MSFAQLNDGPVQTTGRLSIIFFMISGQKIGHPPGRARGIVLRGFGHVYQCDPEQAQSELGICYFEVFTILQEMFKTDAYSSSFYKL